MPPWNKPSAPGTRASGHMSQPDHPTLFHSLDVNGDGLSDFVRMIRSDDTLLVQSLVSLGAQGWKESVSSVALASGSQVEKSFGALDWYGLDVDGDGRADIVNFASSKAG